MLLHSSTLAWETPWTEEPGRLQPMGSRRVGHNCTTSVSLFTFMHWRRKWQPTPVFLPGESQGRRSLVSCRLWGRTESDTTDATWQQQQQPCEIFKNHAGRTYSMKEKAGQKHKPLDVFDFPDHSRLSSLSRLGENERDEESYETFDPPLHSTAIYADEEEFSKRCKSPLPSTEEAKRSSDTSETEASENESVKISAKKPRRQLKPISDESESPEESDVRRKVKPTENLSTQHEAISATALPGLSEKPAEAVTPQKIGPRSAESSAEKATPATGLQLKTQKNKTFPGKRKKPRSYATDSDKKIDSRVCKAAINKFHSNLKEELIKMLREVQMLKTLKRKNAKMISDIEKKRQHLIEVQDELLRVEPELKQLQIKYEELQERKASLRKAAYFLSNLKHLHQDYSDVQEEEPSVKETYDSSSLPALLFKARPLLGAESHLQNINYQLEKLLGQK